MIHSLYASFLPYLVLLTFTTNTLFCQTVREEKMKLLSFMTGEWIGTSTSFKNNTIAKQVAAYEEVQYKLDKNIITIDLHSELLQLHTIIYYDEKDETYYYNPYYKKGAAKYRGKYENGTFIITFNEKQRLVFGITSEGHFREYGEKLKDGAWYTYFEDIFRKSP